MTEELQNQTKTVVVGMSGGVDSSVAALLLVRAGYNVVGLHMKSANDIEAENDEANVRRLCESLKIKCEVVNYKSQMQIVKDYFIKEYLAGRTPNPCVICNKEVKFKPFVEYAEKLGADFFATGHYARIKHEDGKHVLYTAIDSDKDQTYFLSELSQSQIEKAIFPLGELTKPEVRKIAEEAELVSANKKDSYDVCFVGNQKFKDFMNEHYPEKSGDIVDIATKKVVGKHTGISKYTLGQRKGLGVGGGHGSSGECWFVVDKDIKTNTLFVAQGADDALYSKALKTNRFNWLAEKPAENKFECYAKFRYRQTMQKVNVETNDDGSVLITFAERQRAITPGQYAVLYMPIENGAFTCLGGGQIDTVIKNI